MKIIQTIPMFALAGAETMCQNLTLELQKLGHTVIVISLYDYKSSITERLEAAGIEVKYLGKKHGIDFSMYKKLYRIFKQEQPDVIHSHLATIKYTFFAGKLAGIKKNVHTVHNIAQKEAEKPERILRRILFKLFGVVPVALSDIIQKTVSEEYSIPTEKIPVVLNGIDLSRCIPKKEYSASGNFKILHIGRFSAQKNHQRLLTAFKQFHERYKDSELWLIGDGENKPQMIEFTKQNRLDDSVTFLGLQDNVYTYLNKADMFTLSSDYEGVPMTLIEAMGSGLPIVSTAVGGIPNMLSDDSAILTDLDPNEMESAFERYYNDAELRKSHGTRAKEQAVEFSAATMAERYLAVYKK